MGATFVIAAKDLRQRLRDRSALVLGFVAPLVIAGLMSAAFHGTDTFHASLGLADLDHGSLGSSLSAVLTGPDVGRIASVRRLDSAAARADVKSGRLDAALVIPANFTAAAQSGGPVPALEVVASPDHLIAAHVAEAIARSFVAQLNADRLSVATALAAGTTLRADELASRAANLQLPETVSQQPVGHHPLKAVSYYAPAMGMFFLFFAVGFGARGYMTERREGTLDRLAVAPVRPRQILAGKALSIFVYGVSSMTVMWLVTSWVFGARWGSPVAVEAVILAVVTAVVAVCALVITWARTERQVETFSSVATFGLTIVGGNFFFISAAPVLMRRLALLTPNGWALRAFIDLATTTGGLSTVFRPLVAIAVFTAVVAGVAAARARALVSG